MSNDRSGNVTLAPPVPGLQVDERGGMSYDKGDNVTHTPPVPGLLPNKWEGVVDEL